jgi:alkyl sulfatase BDS1-like metallo-beta-lactamase superfamily hydrolase
VYDEPEYVVRNIWRLYGGWWDGVASHLKPVPESVLGREVVSLAGGLDALLDRVRTLVAAGDVSLASHLVDWAVAAEPESPAAHELRARVYEARAASAGALMTRGIFSAIAADSARRAGGTPALSSDSKGA